MSDLLDKIRNLNNKYKDGISTEMTIIKELIGKIDNLELRLKVIEEK